MFFQRNHAPPFLLPKSVCYAASWHTLFVSEDDPVHSAEPRMNKTLLNVKAPETLYGLRELLSIKKLIERLINTFSAPQTCQAE